MRRIHKLASALLTLLAPAAALAQECLTAEALAPGAAPPVCSYAQMAYDSARQRTVWVGGSGQSAFQTWEWNGGAWTHIALPPEMAFALYWRIPGFVYDSDRQLCVLLSAAGDTWEYSGGVWNNRHIPGPTLRTFTHMAYDPERHTVVLFGGFDAAASATLGDTWTFDGDAWTQRTPAHAPGPRTNSAMAFDSRRGAIVLHGGSGAGGAVSETWEWNGQDWALASVSGPPRAGHRAVYDAQAGMTVIYDGSSLDANSQFVSEPSAWGWDGVEWRFLANLALPSFRPCTYSASAYDSLRGEIVHCASTQTPLATNRLRLGFATIVSQPKDLLAQEGALAAFGVTVSSSRPVAYQWRRNGQPIGGQTEATLLLQHVGANQAGDYDCVVTNTCGAEITRAAHLAVQAECAGDINHDGARDFLDLNALLSNYGQGCGPN